MHSALITGLIATLTLFSAPVLARGPWAGGIDMAEACRMQRGAGAEARNDKPDSLPGSAFNWYCTGDIDTNRYCRERYGNNAQSDAQGQKKYDWGCYFP